MREEISEAPREMSPQALSVPATGECPGRVSRRRRSPWHSGPHSSGAGRKRESIGPAGTQAAEPREASGAKEESVLLPFLRPGASSRLRARQEEPNAASAA